MSAGRLVEVSQRTPPHSSRAPVQISQMRMKYDVAEARRMQCTTWCMVHAGAWSPPALAISLPRCRRCRSTPCQAEGQIARHYAVSLDLASLRLLLGPRTCPGTEQQLAQVSECHSGMRRLPLSTMQHASGHHLPRGCRCRYLPPRYAHTALQRVPTSPLASYCSVSTTAPASPCTRHEVC